MKKSKKILTFYYSTALLFTIITVYPIFLMIQSSFKTNIEIFEHPFSWPAVFSLDTYRELLEKLPFFQYFLNSVIVSVISGIFILLFASMASFYIARFSFKWNGILFFIFLVGMMIPIKLGIIPLFTIMQKLNFLNSLWSLIFVYTSMGIPLSILILTGFFKTLPKELEESARIDGASNFRIIWSILFPLMRPALGTVMIVNFIESWNDFFFPLIFIQDEIE